MAYKHHSRKDTYPRCPTLDAWLKAANPSMIDKLATLAETSPLMFRQWVHGRRGMRAETAGRIELASKRMAEEDPKAPEPLLRGDLCEACRNCEYFKTSLK